MLSNVNAREISIRVIREPKIVRNSLLVESHEVTYLQPTFYMIAPWGISRTLDDTTLTGRLEAFYPDTRKVTNSNDPALGIIRTIGTSVLPLNKNIHCYIPSAHKWGKTYDDELSIRGFTVDRTPNIVVNTTFTEKLMLLRKIAETDAPSVINITDELQGPRQELMILLAANALGWTEALENRLYHGLRLIEENEGWNIFQDETVIDMIKEYYKNDKDRKEIAHTLDVVHAFSTRCGELVALARDNFDSITEVFLRNTDVHLDEYVSDETFSYAPRVIPVRHLYTDVEAKITGAPVVKKNLLKWLNAPEGLFARAKNLKGIIDILVGTYYTQNQSYKIKAENYFIANSQYDVFYHFGAITKNQNRNIFVGKSY